MEPQRESGTKHLQLKATGWFSIIRTRIVLIASLLLLTGQHLNFTCPEIIKLSNFISYCNDFAVIQNILSLITRDGQ